MNRISWKGLLALAAALGVTSATVGAGDDKTGAWSPFLPKDAAKELTQRALKRLNDLSKSEDKNARTQSKAEEAILAGTTLATSDPRAVMDAEAKTKKLTEAIKEAKGVENGKVWRGQLEELNDLMYVFRTKTKGGEGLAADLQYTPKLKNLNGTEDLVSALAAKKLTDANVEKVAKELPLLGYRIAVIGAITHDYGPTGKKGDAKEWQALSLKMRDAGIALAESAQKKDAAAINDSAKRLESSCIECHRAFR